MRVFFIYERYINTSYYHYYYYYYYYDLENELLLRIFQDLYLSTKKISFDTFERQSKQVCFRHVSRGLVCKGTHCN